MEIRLGRPPLPREHGAWAMLLTPPIVALLAAKPDGLGLVATLGWFAAYAMRGPLEVLIGRGASGRAGMASGEPAVARFWLLLFGAVAVACLAPVTVAHPGVLGLLTGAGALLGLVYWLALRGQTRSLAVGLVAVVGLTAGGPLYYLASTGSVPRAGWQLAYACFAFFGGSVFRVKALARERRHARFRWLSVAIHMAFAVGGLAQDQWLWAPLTPPLLSAFYGACRGGNGPAANLGTVGRVETWLTLLFAFLLILSLRLP
jgi:hypothetical protein